MSATALLSVTPQQSQIFLSFCHVYISYFVSVAILLGAAKKTVWAILLEGLMRIFFVKLFIFKIWASSSGEEV